MNQGYDGNRWMIRVLVALLVALLVMVVVGVARATPRVGFEATPECERLVGEIGVAAVEHLNRVRGPEPDVMAVCERVAAQWRWWVSTNPEHKGSPPLALVLAVGYHESGMRLDPRRRFFRGPLQVGLEWCEDVEGFCVVDGVGHLATWRIRRVAWKGALEAYVGRGAKHLRPEPDDEPEIRRFKRRRIERKDKYVRDVLRLWANLEGDPREEHDSDGDERGDPGRGRGPGVDVQRVGER